MFRVKAIVPLTLCLLALASVAPAMAQDFTFGLRPEDQSIGYFQYTLNPGETVEDAVLAVNGTEQAMRLIVSTVAGHTALTGGISFPGEADGPASWISFPDGGLIEVPPKLAVRLPFTLSVPSGTPPGEYVAGFLSTPENPADGVGGEAAEGAMNIQIVPQMGVSIIIYVPGPQLCQVTLRSITKEIDRGGWKVVMDMANTGNVHFKGTGAFILRPLIGGDPVVERSFQVGYFVSGDTIGYPLYFDSLPVAGEYTADVRVVGGDCAFTTDFSQPVTISEEEFQRANEEAERWQKARDEAAAEAQAMSSVTELLKAAGTFLLGLAALASIGFLVFFVVSRRKKEGKQQDGS